MINDDEERRRLDAIRNDLPIDGDLGEAMKRNGFAPTIGGAKLLLKLESEQPEAFRAHIRRIRASLKHSKRRKLSRKYRYR